MGGEGAALVAGGDSYGNVMDPVTCGSGGGNHLLNSSSFLTLL